MINPTKNVKMTIIGYTTEISGKTFKYYDDVFFLTPMRLGKMYLNKYTNKKYQFTINPFNAEEI